MARTNKRRHREGNFQRGSVNMQNVEEAIRNLRAKGEHVLQAAKTALKDGADVIVADAKSRCPVDTGKLRDSIKATSLEDGAVYLLSANAKNEYGVAYGQFVEFDPRIARPFLYPAVDANIDNLRNNVKQAIQDAINGGSYGNNAA